MLRDFPAAHLGLGDALQPQDPDAVRNCSLEIPAATVLSTVFQTEHCIQRSQRLKKKGCRKGKFCFTADQTVVGVRHDFLLPPRLLPPLHFASIPTVGHFRMLDGGFLLVLNK